MKSKLLLSTALLLGMLVLSSFKNPANEQFVKFSIKNAGISVDGFFDKFQVKVVYDESNLAQSSFSGSIDVNSINTGIEMRDGHLKGEEYFDAQTYPKITFVSTSISKISSTELKVDGKLTIKNIAKKVVLNVQVSKTGNIQYFETELTIDRLDFGVGESSWVMSDNVVCSVRCIVQ